MAVSYIPLLIVTLLGSGAALLLKRAALSGGIVQALRHAPIYGGGALYLSSALLNILILKKLPYSVVLPFTSLTYVWTLLLAHAFYGERLTIRKTFGVVGVVAGVMLVSL